MSDNKNSDNTVDKSFNDSELEDIMNEIENLEKEFVSDVTESSVDDFQIDEEDVALSDYQSEIDDKRAVQMPVKDKQIETPTTVIEEMPEMELQNVENVSTNVDETQDVVDKMDTIEDNSSEFEDKLQAIEDTIEKSTVAEVPEPVIVDTPKPKLNIQRKDNIIPIKKDAQTWPTNETTEKTEMNFAVSGNMDLQLNFKVGDQHIMLYLNQQDGLTIEAEHGMKFTIPLGDVATSAKRKIS